MKTLIYQNRKVAVIGNHSWASAAYKTMVDYVQNQFKNCELLEPSLDFKSSLQDDQEAVIDEIAKKIADDVKAYPDPKTLL